MAWHCSEVLDQRFKESAWTTTGSSSTPFAPAQHHARAGAVAKGQPSQFELLRVLAYIARKAGWSCSERDGKHALNSTSIRGPVHGDRIAWRVQGRHIFSAGACNSNTNLVMSTRVQLFQAGHRFRPHAVDRHGQRRAVEMQCASRNVPFWRAVRLEDGQAIELEPNYAKMGRSLAVVCFLFQILQLPQQYHG
uniref:Ndc10 domain-containing protein n=1 Tax=Globodera rostochiensis TaxID=31243 RepID=A0A914HIX4_GLORO